MKFAITVPSRNPIMLTTIIIAAINSMLTPLFLHRISAIDIVRMVSNNSSSTPAIRQPKATAACSNAKICITQENLPDWVKVGEPVYNIEKKQYQTISLINGTVICKNIDSEGCTQYGYGAFMSDCVEARKRPFNEAEMKALVGKVVKNKEDNLMLVTMFYPKSGGQIKFCNMWYTAKDLMKNSYTVDGKPCYKLKHLNDKGEWVE